MKNFEALRSALNGRVLAFYEPALLAMLATMENWMGAGIATPQTQARRVAATSPGAKGLVATIPMHGVIERSGGFLSMFFGGCSPDMLTEQLRQAVNDPSISAIVLDVDSPGGSTDGIDELAQEIYQARKKKPITAVSNSMMASAAYYLASQASEILASPSSMTGSIGVYALHEDDSQMLENAGVKITPIYYGENKVDGSPFMPLSDSAREHMQEMVDAFGQMFEKAVGRGRRMSADEVHKKFGQGRVFTAAQAAKLGMVDRVGTLDDALAAHGAVRGVGVRAENCLADYHKAINDGWMTPDEASARLSYGTFAEDKPKTKRVDSKDVPKSGFAYRPDDNLENWKLPIESPDGDAEWEKSHIRNAISRWSQTDMPDAEEKSKARGRIKAAAKKYDIDVSDDSLALGSVLIEAQDFTPEEIARSEEIAAQVRSRRLALLEF